MIKKTVNVWTKHLQDLKRIEEVINSAPSDSFLGRSNVMDICAEIFNYMYISKKRTGVPKVKVKIVPRKNSGLTWHGDPYDKFVFVIPKGIVEVEEEILNPEFDEGKSLDLHKNDDNVCKLVDISKIGKKTKKMHDDE
jgi:hypothetical protein